MPTLEEIHQQIRDLGEVDTFGTKKEIRYLPEILTEDESVRALTSGLMDGNTWLIVCTEKRVIFLDKGMFYGLKQSETPLEKINSIEQKTGMIFGSIAIWNGAARMDIKNVMKKTVRPFVERVNRAREAIKTSEGSGRVATAAQPAAPLVDLNQLERLSDLFSKGTLTEAEFLEAKQKVLQP